MKYLRGLLREIERCSQRGGALFTTFRSYAGSDTNCCVVFVFGYHVLKSSVSSREQRKTNENGNKKCAVCGVVTLGVGDRRCRGGDVGHTRTLGRAQPLRSAKKKEKVLSPPRPVPS